MDDLGDTKVLLIAQVAIERLCLFVAGGILFFVVALTLSELVLFPGAIFRTIASRHSPELNLSGNLDLNHAAVDVDAMQRAERARQRQALRINVEGEIVAADTVIKQAENADSKLRTDFENATTIRIDAKKWTRPINEQLVTHEEFKKAWDRVRAAPIDPGELRQRRDVVASVRERLANDTFTDSDLTETKDACEWGKKKLEIIQSRAADLDHIRVMLKAAAFEDAKP